MGTPWEVADALARVAVSALLNSLWQGIALAALAWGLVRLLRGPDAATRYRVWWAATLATLALFGAGLMRPAHSPAPVEPNRPAGRAPATTG